MSAKTQAFPKPMSTLSWEIRMIKWSVYKVFIPLAVMLIIWPIYYYALEIDQPFAKAFTHAELLIFSALLLTEAVIEGEHTLVADWRFQLGRHVTLLLAFLALILFVVVKFDVMRNENSPNPDKMYFYSCVGWGMAVLSALISVYSFSKTAYEEATKEFNQIAQELHA